MSTNFPTALDTLSNPSALDGLTGHAAQHANANDAIEALQAKVGIDNSTDTSSLDYRMGAVEDGKVDKVVGKQLSTEDYTSAEKTKLADLNTDVVPEGSTNLYFTAVRVRDAVLTGLSTATNAVIAATDSVLTAFGKIQAQITGHTSNTLNPHGVTKAQVGLGNVDNTSDASKPVSTAQQTALNAKLTAASNLSDVASVSTARANLGLRPVGGGTADTPRNDLLGSSAYASIEQIPLNLWPNVVTGAKTLTLSDNSKVFVVQGTVTVTLPPASGVFNASRPYSIAVKSATGATVTVARSGSDTIEGAAADKAMSANTGLVFYPISTAEWETL